MLNGNFKICKFCGENRDINLYRKHSAQCKICIKIKQSEYRTKNKDRILKRNKEYYLENKESILLKGKEYRLKNQEAIKDHDRKRAAIKRAKIVRNCKDCGSVIGVRKIYCNICGSKRKRESNCKSRLKALDKEKQRRAGYYQKNKERIKAKRREYVKNNWSKIVLKAHNRYIANREEILEYHRSYRQKNKEKIKKRKREYEESIKENLTLRLRRRVRNSVYCALLRSNSKKNGSILKYLPYTIEELKKHLELQFESWMNWHNWGIYDPETWDDNDFSTWTWQIDHIIPQSYLPYDSMEHPNFQKCWALSNLRPLSAKQNVGERNRRQK